MSNSHRSQSALSSVATLDLKQWNLIVGKIDDPTVAHAILEVFESEDGAALREQYPGIYLRLRLTKHQERVSYAQAVRRAEHAQMIGQMIGRYVRAFVSCFSSKSLQVKA